MLSSLTNVQKLYPAINKAGGEFLPKLTGTDIKKDITLAAEMAGLMLLRDSSAKLENGPVGCAILGAVSDDAYQTLNGFVIGWEMSNGLNPKDIDFAALSSEAKKHLPELTQYEQPFCLVCEANGIARELFAFVAATSALKLVMAAKMLGILDARIGQALVRYHIIAGSKMVPYPPPSDSQ